MLSIDTLVPGFNRALEAVPGAVETARALEDSLGEGTLSPRTAALIRVAVAQRVGVPYACWAMNRIAAREHVSAEDIFLASCGCARDAAEDKVLKASGRMAVNPRRSHPAEFDALADHVGEERATEVVAQVALSMLACEALAAIAPSAGKVARGRA
jgi:alkylhydroperoxidase/carboxymuconolactone decarboxylase family protein YurZ